MTMELDNITVELDQIRDLIRLSAEGCLQLCQNGDTAYSALYAIAAQVEGINERISNIAREQMRANQEQGIYDKGVVA